jgi:hypothetical protein
MKTKMQITLRDFCALTMGVRGDEPEAKQVLDALVRVVEKIEDVVTGEVARITAMAAETILVQALYQSEPPEVVHEFQRNLTKLMDKLVADSNARCQMN